MSDDFLQGLSWEPANRASSLDAVFRYALAHVEDATSWYRQKVKWKRVGARSLRLGAVAAVSVAGILPILTQIFITDGKPRIDPAWASVALALAAAMYAFDRLLDCTSGWMRYIPTELRLRRLSTDFKLGWERERATWNGGPPGDDELKAMLGRAQQLVAQVDSIVEQETLAWIREFGAAVKQLEHSGRRDR